MNTGQQQVFAPSKGGSNTIGITTYAAAAGVPLLVPSAYVASVLTASGWSWPTRGGADITANRPTLNLSNGQLFTDLTLNIVIVWDGANWRNVVTGAIS